MMPIFFDYATIRYASITSLTALRAMRYAAELMPYYAIDDAAFMPCRLLRCRCAIDAGDIYAIDIALFAIRHVTPHAFIIADAATLLIYDYELFLRFRLIADAASCRHGQRHIALRHYDADAPYAFMPPLITLMPMP